MPQFLPNKENAPDFSNPSVQKAYIQDARTSKSLLQKELDLNREERNLLQKRILMMSDFINELSANDPQYSMLLTQVKMDQIEIDELKTREMWLIQNLTET
jgi:hypothetical protein